VFQVGRELLQAKQGLPHGEFQRMVERELPFNSDTARRYMAIVSAKHFQNRPIGTVLPSSWYTLSVLQRLDQSTFDTAVQAGKIHPEMTRADAEALLPKKPLAPVVPMDEGSLLVEMNRLRRAPDGLTCDRQVHPMRARCYTALRSSGCSLALASRRCPSSLAIFIHSPSWFRTQNS
jgi:hypothetical protein